jgi:hypothetical protein
MLPISFRMGLVRLFISLANEERVHHYQRERASITGLRLWSGNGIETERLVVVVTARLVLRSFYSVAISRK